MITTSFIVACLLLFFLFVAGMVAIFSHDSNKKLIFLAVGMMTSAILGFFLATLTVFRAVL